MPPAPRPRTSKPNKLRIELAPTPFGLHLFSCARQTLPASARFPLKLTSVAGKHQRRGCALSIPGRPGSAHSPSRAFLSLFQLHQGQRFSEEGQDWDFGRSLLFDICIKENSRASRTSSQPFSSKRPARAGQLFLRGTLRRVCY